MLDFQAETTTAVTRREAADAVRLFQIAAAYEAAGQAALAARALGLAEEIEADLATGRPVRLPPPAPSAAWLAPPTPRLAPVGTPRPAAAVPSRPALPRQTFTVPARVVPAGRARKLPPSYFVTKTDPSTGREMLVRVQPTA